METFKKWLDANTAKGKESLFYITAALTLAYFVLILLRFFKGVNFANIPPSTVVFYISVLSAYVGVKSLDKVRNGNNDVNNGNVNKKRGELFFISWSLLYGILGFLVGLNKGEAVVLQETLPTALTVLGLYTGTETLKAIIAIIQTKKNGQTKT